MATDLWRETANRLHMPKSFISDHTWLNGLPLAHTPRVSEISITARVGQGSNKAQIKVANSFLVTRDDPRQCFTAAKKYIVALIAGPP